MKTQFNLLILNNNRHVLHTSTFCDGVNNYRMCVIKRCNEILHSSEIVINSGEYLCLSCGGHGE